MFKHNYGENKRYKNNPKVRAERRRSALLGKAVKDSIDDIDDALFGCQEALVHAKSEQEQYILKALDILNEIKQTFNLQFDEDVQNSIRMKDACNTDCDW